MSEEPPKKEINRSKFAALRLAKYNDEIPQIGKIIDIQEFNVTIEWWIGTYSTNWMPWKSNGQLNLETVHENAIIMTLELAKTQRIQKNDISALKNLYSDVEFM